jgi:hypothetical protein
MKARILLLVAFFYLPYSLIAQNQTIQSASQLSLHEKQINNYLDNCSVLNEDSLAITSISKPDTLKTMCDGKERSLYIIRFVGEDNEDCISFSGISIGGVHANLNAIFSGLCLNMGLGNPPIQGKSTNNISFNGINFSLIVTGITGTINGFSFGGFWGNSAKAVNGIAIGLLGTNSDYLNGLALGGLMSFSQYANAIQVAGILNAYCNFNGIGIALINSTMSGFEETMTKYATDTCNENKLYGIILGLYNAVDVKGLSLGLMNNGNGWLQIGLLNIGNSVLQLGLVNFDADWKIGIPIINFNF